MTDDVEEWTAACGDRFAHRGDALVLRTARAIPDLEPSPHRRPILVVRDARFTLHGLRRDGADYVYELAREQPNDFAPPGKTLEYDEDRHLALRRARRHQAVAWVVYLVLAPLSPLLGLLPHGAKAKLEAYGLHASTATGLSIPLQGVLIWPTIFIFWGTILLGASWPAVVFTGGLAIALGFDVAYRWSGFHEDPPVARGAFSWVAPTLRFAAAGLRAGAAWAWRRARRRPGR